MPLRFAETATEAYPFPLTLRHLLDSALTHSVHQQIIYRDQASYSYRDLAGRIGRLASALQALGTTQGMTIAMMDWDSHRYLEAYFAVPMMGAVLQTVNVRLPVPQLAYTLAHAQAEILIVHRDFALMVDALLPRLPRIKAIVFIADGADVPLPNWASGEYETLSAAAAPDFPFEDFDENALATTFYTTGTTGDPKAVSFTHRQLVLHTLAATGPFGATSASPALGFDDVYMPLTPMFHVHAWGLPYVATMLGVKQVYPGRYDADMICRLRTTQGVTFSHCVPTILQMILDEAEKSGTDLAGWSMIIGGSALSPPLCRAALSKGMDVVAGYGMSETGPMIALGRRDGAADVSIEERVADSVTLRTVPLVSARVVDEALQDVPHDGETRGELVLRAPWLTGSYGGNAASTEALWRGGWMHSQDVATIDAKGRILIRDRLKDVVKSGGEWIDSLQLEQIILEVDDVAEVAVIAVPDPRWGERPLAVIVARPDASPSLEAINRPIHVAIEAGQVTRYAKLEKIALVEGLPRTSVGKIDKKALRAAFS